MQREWDLYYAEWMIGDGEPHREVGDIFETFCLEFYSREGLGISTSRSKSSVAASGHRYRVSAEILHISEGRCLIDFGLKLVGWSDALPPKCKQGDYVTGDLAIAIPQRCSFPPSRWVAHGPVPVQMAEATRCKWKLENILADITPWVSSNPNGSGHLVRDESRIQYEEVPSTDSVKAYGYILQCYWFE